MRSQDTVRMKSLVVTSGLRAAPYALVHSVIKLVKSGRDEAYDSHKKYPSVQAPEAPLEKRIRPGVFPENVPRREKHECYGQKTVHAEERGMGVDRGRVDART